VATPRRISDFKPLITNLAQTSHYQVIFGALPKQVSDYLLRRGVDSRFITNDAGLLCFNASLPGAQLATGNVSGNYMGIQEKFAHSRIFTQISLDFYVDKEYKVIKFLEHWMEFIASGSHNPIGTTNQPLDQNQKNYVIRMQYPEYYKTNATKIIKFERDYTQEMQYNFYGMFPSNLSSMQVGYDASRTLTASVTFEFDRYTYGKNLSVDKVNREDNNKRPDLKFNDAKSAAASAEATLKNAQQGGFPEIKLDTLKFNPQAYNPNINLGSKDIDSGYFQVL
jgi:hypothetical protein